MPDDHTDMSRSAGACRPTVLMIAYTNYRTDPRVIREAEAAAGAGFEVDFIALRRDHDPPVELINGVRVIHLNQLRYRGDGLLRYLASYAEFFVRCFFRTTWLHLKKRYRVVHVNNMPDLFVFCALVPKLAGARLILDIHDPMPNTFASKFRTSDSSLLFRLLLWQERLSAAFVDAVLTVSEPVKEHLLVGQHGIRPERVEVIANFADDELFELQPPTPLGAKLRMIFHGSILARYGLRQAMHAVAGVRQRDRLELTIIGEGDFSHELKQLITDLDLGDIVTFDNRMYPLHEIPDRLTGFHLGFVPMEISSITQYALPLKLLEYLSIGLPSVTVRNVAVAHYFTDEDCIFYDPNDSQSFARVLNAIADDPKVVIKYQRRAIELRSRFLWSAERMRYAALLRRLAAR